MTGIGLCVPQLGEGLDAGILREFCERAEAFGYASLWVQDHFMWPLDPERGYAGRPGTPIPEQYRSVLAPTELLAAIATWTTRVRIGTSVLVAGHHWPVPLAQRLATIDLLSQGRLDVGLGIGWNAEEHTASGTEITTRGRRIDDFIPALLACWGEDPVSHDGPFFQVPPSVVRPKPVQRPRPPLLSGMWSPAGLARTAASFDGWNPAGLPVDRVTEIAADLAGRRPAGLAPLTIHHRAFVQTPHGPPPGPEVLDRMADEAAAAAAAGFDDYIVEHNFWAELADPRAWLEVPERFAVLIDAAS